MEDEEEITEGPGKNKTLFSIKIVIIVWLIALLILVPMFLFMMQDDPPLLRIEEDSAEEGRYIGTVQGDIRKLTSRIVLTISDDSAGLGFSMDPLQHTETVPYNWTEDTPVLNCTYHDKNGNFLLDKGDEFIFNNVEKGDIIYLFWKPTGGTLFWHTF